MAGVPLLLMMPEVVTGLGLGTRDGLRLEVRLGGTARVETIPSITAQAGVDALLGRAVPGGRSIALPTAATRALVFQRPNDGYWLRQERESGLLYAQIDQVFDDGNPVRLDQDTARLSLREFGQAVLARIDSGQVHALVLDLRNNPGGNNGLIVPLVAGLAARPAINQRGRLFVITGRATYSAAMNFVSLLEDRTEAIFVGEPPGGSPSHYGDATAFSLPASGLDLYVSTLHWDTGVRPTDVREEQEPELAIAPRFADLVAGRDSAMAAIRAWQPGASLSERLLALYRSGGLAAAPRGGGGVREGPDASPGARADPPAGGGGSSPGRVERSLPAVDPAPIQPRRQDRHRLGGASDRARWPHRIATGRRGCGCRLPRG